MDFKYVVVWDTGESVTMTAPNMRQLLKDIGDDWLPHIRAVIATGIGQSEGGK